MPRVTRTGRTRANNTRQRTARAKTVAKARGATKAIYKQPYVPATVKRDTSIAALSRAVSKLQRSQIGPYQKSVQFVKVTSGEGLIGWDDRPVIFMANDFTEANEIFTVNTTTGVTSAVPAKKFDKLDSGFVCKKCTWTGN